MDLKKFNFIKNKYGLHASWAIWENKEINPKAIWTILIFIEPSVYFRRPNNRDSLFNRRCLNTSYIFTT